MTQKSVFHVHSYRCGHNSTEPDLAYVQKAIKLGAEELVFTDRAPFPGNPFQSRMSIYALPEYLYSLQELKKRYESIIQIKIGLEMEYLPNFKSYYDFLKEQEVFNLFLLGPHFSLMPDGSYSFQAEKKSSIIPYLADGLIAGMESGLFQAVAHPDQIFRYKKKWNSIIYSYKEENCKMAKFNHILNIEDKMGKHWDINRALDFNGLPAADLAVNAETGLEMIEQAVSFGNPYDLLITDMHFPVNGVDNHNAGLYVIEELKRRKVSVPVIVCSSRRYNIPEIAGCIFHNRNRDLYWDFKELLYKM